MAWRRRDRFTTTPSREEVNVRAIPLLKPGGWKLLAVEEVTLVGAVPKDYLAYGVPRNASGANARALRTLGFIAKKGRLQANVLECITEEIISKIGAMLPVRMAESSLVRVARHDVRFLSRDFVDVGRQTLRHGIEIAAEYFGATLEEVIDTFRLADKGAERGFYTVGNMLTILRDLYPAESRDLVADFGRMLAFDAFVGAPDRHGMNWGVLAPREEAIDPVRFAPVFDTARGLFVNLSDDRLALGVERQGDEFIERYARRSRPILSVDRSTKQNHFELAAGIMREHPSLAPALQEVFDAVSIPAIERMLQRRFRRLISQRRLGLIVSLLEFRIRVLREEALP